jgi:hypothetical protein
MTLANKQRESERFLAGVKQQLSVAQRELIDQLVCRFITIEIAN